MLKFAQFWNWGFLTFPYGCGGFWGSFSNNNFSYNKKRALRKYTLLLKPITEHTTPSSFIKLMKSWTFLLNFCFDLLKLLIKVTDVMFLEE